MYREALSGIEGIWIYSVIGLLIFLATFIFIVIKTVQWDKSEAHSASLIPLQDNFESSKIQFESSKIQTDFFDKGISHEKE